MANSDLTSHQQFLIFVQFFLQHLSTTRDEQVELPEGIYLMPVIDFLKILIQIGMPDMNTLVHQTLDSQTLTTIESDVNSTDTSNPIVQQFVSFVGERLSTKKEFFVPTQIATQGTDINSLLGSLLVLPIPPTESLETGGDDATATNSGSRVKMSSLSTMADVQVCEECLQEDINCQSTLSLKLKQQGGKSIRHHVSRALHYFMDKDLAKLFSWDGVDGKKSFQDLTVSRILIDAIVEAHPADVDCCRVMVENVIKEWLDECGAE